MHLHPDGEDSGVRGDAKDPLVRARVAAGNQTGHRGAVTVEVILSSTFTGRVACKIDSLKDFAKKVRMFGVDARINDGYGYSSATVKSVSICHVEAA